MRFLIRGEYEVHQLILIVVDVIFRGSTRVYFIIRGDVCGCDVACVIDDNHQPSSLYKHKCDFIFKMMMMITDLFIKKQMSEWPAQGDWLLRIIFISDSKT